MRRLTLAKRLPVSEVEVASSVVGMQERYAIWREQVLNSEIRKEGHCRRGGQLKRPRGPVVAGKSGLQIRYRRQKGMEGAAEGQPYHRGAPSVEAAYGKKGRPRAACGG
ncbi:hypothetical protein GOP47_0030970 [Adiantum capillus-veneris]|nr:hypothetical protein GOP47_0030970 [Adiantum capillus-veneris]